MITFNVHPQNLILEMFITMQQDNLVVSVKDKHDNLYLCRVIETHDEHLLLKGAHTTFRMMIRDIERVNIIEVPE